jgi:hypothetical protein
MAFGAGMKQLEQMIVMIKTLINLQLKILGKKFLPM